MEKMMKKFMLKAPKEDKPKHLQKKRIQSQDSTSVILLVDLLANQLIEKMDVTPVLSLPPSEPILRMT